MYVNPYGFEWQQVKRGELNQDGAYILGVGQKTGSISMLCPGGCSPSEVSLLYVVAWIAPPGTQLQLLLSCESPVLRAHRGQLARL